LGGSLGKSSQYFDVTGDMFVILYDEGVYVGDGKHKRSKVFVLVSTGVIGWTWDIYLRRLDEIGL
jgi:hypothetical protein